MCIRDRYSYVLLAHKLDKNVDDVTDEEVEEHLRKHEAKYAEEISKMTPRLNKKYLEDPAKWERDTDRYIKSLTVD